MGTHFPNDALSSVRSHSYTGQHLILLGPPHSSLLQSRHLKVHGLLTRHGIGCGTTITHFKAPQQDVFGVLKVDPQSSPSLRQISP
jgi:hypothetical protein